MSTQHPASSTHELSRQMKKLPPACLLCKEHLAEAGAQAALSPRHLPPLFQELTPDPYLELSARNLRGVISWAMSGLVELHDRGELGDEWDYDERHWEWKGWETYLAGDEEDMEETEEGEDGESGHVESDDSKRIAGERVTSMVVDRLQLDREFRGRVAKAISQVVKGEDGQDEEVEVGAEDATAAAPSIDADTQVKEPRKDPPTAPKPNIDDSFYAKALRQNITIAKAKLEALRADTALLRSEFEVSKERIAGHTVRAFAREETIARAMGSSKAWGVPFGTGAVVTPGSTGGWSAEVRGLGKELVGAWTELAEAEMDLSRETQGRSLVATVLEGLKRENAFLRDTWAGIIGCRGGDEGNSLAEDTIFAPRSWLGRGRIRAAGEEDPWEKEEWEVEIVGDEAGNLWMVPSDVFTKVLPELMRVVADEVLEEGVKVEIVGDEAGGVWVSPDMVRALIDEPNSDEEMDMDIYQ